MTVDTPPRATTSRDTTPRGRRGKTAEAPAPDVPGEALLEELLEAVTALRDGDFSVRLARREGLVGQLAERINEVAALQERRNRELIRVSRVIGREGRMTERLDEVDSEGGWASGAEAVNSLI